MPNDAKTSHNDENDLKNPLNFQADSEYYCKGSILNDFVYAARICGNRAILEFIVNRAQLFKILPDDRRFSMPGEPFKVTDKQDNKEDK